MPEKDKKKKNRQEALGMPTAREMFPVRENPNVTYYPGDVGWKSQLPEAQGMESIPYYTGKYTTRDPSVGDWSLQGTDNPQLGYLAGQYFDPRITNPYTQNIPIRQPANPQLSPDEVSRLEQGALDDGTEQQRIRNLTEFLSRMFRGKRAPSFQPDTLYYPPEQDPFGGLRMYHSGKMLPQPGHGLAYPRSFFKMGPLTPVSALNRIIGHRW